MNDRDDIDPAGEDVSTGEPVQELASLDLDPDPELPGRVQRSIQRRIFVADSLDFSLAVMLTTFWGYLCTLMETVGDNNPTRED